MTSISLSMMSSTQIRYNLIVGQMEISAREVYNLYEVCRISFYIFSSLLFFIAVLRMAQTEKDGGVMILLP